MKFSGKRLARVLKGLQLAHDELHNMIATCPDVVLYKDVLAGYVQEQEQMQRLIDEIEAKNPGLADRHPINL